MHHGMRELLLVAPPGTCLLACNRAGPRAALQGQVRNGRMRALGHVAREAVLLVRPYGIVCRLYRYSIPHASDDLDTCTDPKSHSVSPTTGVWSLSAALGWRAVRGRSKKAVQAVQAVHAFYLSPPRTQICGIGRTPDGGSRRSLLCFEPTTVPLMRSCTRELLFCTAWDLQPRGATSGPARSRSVTAACER